MSTAPAASPGAPPREPRLGSWRLWALGFAAANLVALMVTVQNHYWWNGLPGQLPWHVWYEQELADWYTWLLATPAVFWATRRFPVHGPRRWRNFALHFALAVAFLWVNTVASEAVLVPFFGPDWPAGYTLVEWATRTFLTNTIYVAPIYLTMLGAAHAVYWSRERDRREVGEARLQTMLERARRDALRVQLQPAFLFGTLHGVSALMERDVLAARRMIAQLSSLLRHALEDDPRHEIPLEEEIEFADRYAEIQKLRLEGMLEVIYDVAADTRRLLVPRLILQPLLENAIASVAPGRPAAVTVRARLSAGRLLVRVTDDGAGHGDDAGARARLVALRRRLDELHGDEPVLEVAPRPSGGCAVRIELPARADDRAARGDEDDHAVEAEAPAIGWSDPAPGGWSRGWEPYLAGFLVATAIGVGEGVTNYLSKAGQPGVPPLAFFIGFCLLPVYGWIPAVPLVFWLARRLPVKGPHRVRNLLLHLPLSVALFVGVSFLVELADPLMRLATGVPVHVPSPHTVLERGKMGFTLFAPIYFVFLVLAHAVQASRDALGRRVREARLRALLERAQRDLLRMQLQPHFLFNTLHAVSALMETDVSAARRMITRLGDLLRLALDDDARHEVPLAEEIEFLDRYAEIQKIRFRGRLAVVYRVSPPARRMLVPRLVLQPLVENAIKHGLSRLERPGTVEVHASVDGDRLTVRVLDDGTGLSGGVLARQGVGIGNTRARLEQLYGADQRLSITNRPTGGCEVRIELPAGTEERVADETEHAAPAQLARA